MESCDVLIVGGGPAGSTCAWKLGRSGFDVLVIDAATFPRDKLCAGWITPPVLAELELSPDDYGRGRTLQPITGFRTALIGGRQLETRYASPMSYGIRRCEFDTYLLARSGARLKLGTRVATIGRADGRWIVNEDVRARMLVGAGGHFCPVARLVNPEGRQEPVVATREIEFRMDERQAAKCAVAPDTPELYFCRDLRGYGWCFRKQDYLNVGFGRLGSRGVPAEAEAFADFLKSRGRIPADTPTRWRGHAYLLYPTAPRAVAGDGVLLVGDAAGLAYPESGEGIRPAVESGRLAADTIVAARGEYSFENLGRYRERLEARFGRRASTDAASTLLPSAVRMWMASRLLATRWFTRRFVIERWFLHAHDRT